MSAAIKRTTTARVVFTPSGGAPFAANYTVGGEDVALSVGSGTIHMSRVQLLELAEAIPELVKDLK